MNPLRRFRRGGFRPPAGKNPRHGAMPAVEPGDHVGFLAAMLPRQASAVESHRFGNERVWLKKAGPRHGQLGYRVLALLATALRLDMLKPVPNPGGEAAIAIEARRLRELGAAGLRVPAVLAQQTDGLLISDLGQDGRPAVVLLERLEQAAVTGPAALLATWRDGLGAIAAVHARGLYLSQAFVRNLMQCPDGTIGYIDFEDDPGVTLSLAECQARDWLSYLHSTAQLVHAAVPHAAGAHWHAALAEAEAPVRDRIALAAGRMRWLRHLPGDRRWGRDTQRVRAAALLLTRWYGPDAAA